MVPIKKSNLKNLVLIIGVLLIANGIGNMFFHRFDLTSDKRYTLSETSLNIVKQIKEPLSIKIYMQGELPAEFKRLQQETQQLLEEFQAYNKNIVFTFVNPLENEDSNMDNIKELYRKGLTPVNITVDDKGKKSQAMGFTWAIATYQNKEVNIPLLKNKMGASTTEKVIGSIQNLEYSIADALHKITKDKKKKKTVIKGKGDLKSVFMVK